MYTRNMKYSGRYSPPPGYVGSAFPAESVKHHEPLTDESAVRAEPPAGYHRSEKREGEEDRLALEGLIHSLRGKIGTEELIILLVMLLTSTEGIGVEALILAAVLLAGNEKK